ncbi:hypothetical protein, partial [Candidatus Williamhamiltonella defendens]|uniref:hypothetical protein n=1 Tax=Candidatus Williamhamiltonella defendens TaxID=138072 RepID=UPI0030DB460D
SGMGCMNLRRSGGWACVISCSLGMCADINPCAFRCMGEMWLNKLGGKVRKTPEVPSGSISFSRKFKKGT